MNSNNYKNRLFGFTLTTTIIDGMISLGLVFMVGFAFFLMSESSELIGESADMVSNAREHDLTGGYEMMYGMGGGFVGFRVFASVFTVDSPSVMAILIGCLLIIVLGFSVANLITIRHI